MEDPIDPEIFVRKLLLQSTSDFRHYFIGESEEGNNRLRERMLKQESVPGDMKPGFFFFLSRASFSITSRSRVSASWRSAPGSHGTNVKGSSRWRVCAPHSNLGEQLHSGSSHATESF